MNIEEMNYGTWGKCVCISNNKIEAYVTIDCGPRIIRCGFVGGENFLKEDTELKGANYLGNDCKFDDDTWYNRGGHRLWVSPEAMPRSYYPDNEPVAYTKTENGVLFTPPAQKINNFQLSFEVCMSETENKISVNHFVQNIGYWSVKFAPWALTVLSENGIEVFPQNTEDTGLLSNRMLMLWPYTKIQDERLKMTDAYVRLQQNPSNSQPFKIGLSQQYPWAMYFNHGGVFVKKYEVIDGAEYPDNGCTFESYTNESIMEMESLGEYAVVEPGKVAVHKETWYLYDNVSMPETDEAMDALAKKYDLK